MSHYRSNLRDIEFNLFEVLGRDQVLGHGPFADLDAETARAILAEVERLATHELADSYADVRPRAAGVRPGDPAASRLPGGVRAQLPGLDGRRVVAAADSRRAGRAAGARVAAVGGGRAGARGQPGGLDVRLRSRLRRRHPPQRHRARPADRRSTSSTAGGARPWCSPSPTPAPTWAPGRTRACPQPDGSWHLEGVKRFITSGEHDLSREHRAPGARPPGRASRAPAARAPRGCQPVRGAEAPLRPRDRRADR